MIALKQVVLDDRDPSIVYTGSNWGQEGDVSIEFQGTTTLGTPAPNTFATLHFNGTEINVLGTISASSNVLSSYTLDGGSPTIFSSPNSSNVAYYQSFYNVGGLDPNAQHTLVIQPLQSELFLDMILLVVPETSLPLPASTTSPATLQLNTSASIATATSVPSSSLVSPVVESLPSPLATGQNSINRGGLNVSVGAVVGGTVTGVLLLFVLTLAILYQRTKLKMMRSGELNLRTAKQRSPSAVSPFNYSNSDSPIKQHMCSSSNSNSSLKRQRNGLTNREMQSTETCLSPTTIHTLHAFYRDTRNNLSTESTDIEMGSASVRDPPPTYQNGLASR